MGARRQIERAGKALLRLKSALLGGAAGPAGGGATASGRPAGRRFRQSAAIPFRRSEAGRLEVLLVTSSGGRGWIVPKGLVERGMSEHDSAAKEVMEEAGAVGRVGTEAVGSFHYEKWGGVCDVSVYDMEVERELPDWPERGDRRRKWVAVERAAELVKYKPLGEFIRGLPGRIREGERAR